MATFFYFLGQLFGGQLFELFARETNLKKQSSVQWSLYSSVSVRSLKNDSEKISMATFFVFWVTYLVDSFLSYLPVKRI